MVLSVVRESPRGPSTRRNAKVLKVMRILESCLGTPRLKGTLPPPLDMLIATVLSQNTNDKNSHRAYVRMREQFPTWREVAESSVRHLTSVLKVGGMANLKARRIREILLAVKEEFGDYDLSALSRWNSDRIISELTKMKGVGPKTAACVCLFSLGRDLFPVDTHVHRLCNRLGLVRGCQTPEDTFYMMKGRVPRGKGYAFHTNLIRFGRKVCRSTNPACGDCPLYSLCVFKDKSGRRARPSSTDHSFMLLENVS